MGLAADDLLKFCDHHNHVAKVIDFEALAAGDSRSLLPLSLMLPPAGPAKPAAKAPKAKKGGNASQGAAGEGGKVVKKVNKEGMTIRWEDDFSMWYQEVD